MELMNSLRFTSDNMNGYTDAELAAFNAELAKRLRDLSDDDTDLAADVAKALADEIARR